MPTTVLNIVKFLVRFNISFGEFHRLTRLCGEKKESSNMHIHELTAHTLSEWKSPIYYRTIEQDFFINTEETAFAVR